MIIWVYMHLFVNVVLAHATTAILIILTGFRFLVRIPKKYVYVKIKQLILGTNKQLCSRKEAAQCFVSLNILLSHSRSFKMTLFSRAYATPYQYSIETMSISCTVSEILKMAPYDRSYTTFYWLAIVSIALCCTIFELFDVE